MPLIPSTVPLSASIMTRDSSAKTVPAKALDNLHVNRGAPGPLDDRGCGSGAIDQRSAFYATPSAPTELWAISGSFLLILIGSTALLVKICFALDIAKMGENRPIGGTVGELFARFDDKQFCNRFFRHRSLNKQCGHCSAARRSAGGRDRHPTRMSPEVDHPLRRIVRDGR